MAELNIPDLCGGSAEIAGVQIKFDALIKSGLDGLELDASALSVTIGNDVLSLTAELRKAVPPRPTLPNFNLPAQLTGLSRLSAGSSAHTALLASVKTKFGDGLTAGGFSLDALVSKAGTQIKVGLDLCTAIPNFEVPAAGGDAVEKAIESKHSTEDSEEEKLSKVVENTKLTATKTENETRVAEMQVDGESEDEDVVGGTITSTTPPTEDKGAYTVTEKKKVVSYGEIKTEVTTPADQEGKNVSTSGFSKQPVLVTEVFTTGSPLVLKHKPSKIDIVRGYTTEKLFGVTIFPTPAGHITDRKRWLEQSEKYGTDFTHRGSGHLADIRDTYTISEKTLTIEEKFFTYDGKSKGKSKGRRFSVSYEYLNNYDPTFSP